MSKVNSAQPVAGGAFGNLNRLAYFVAVVETGSFTAAAGRLGVSKAVVSQQVARLEQDFRCTLLIRSTRSVRTTEDGQIFYQRAARILKDADSAFGELAESAGTPSGTLRLTAPLDYGMSVLVRAVATFTQRFPGCQVEAAFSDQIQDLMSGGVDLGVRVGWLTDQQQHLQARHIGSFQQWLVAPAGWARRLEKLRSPAALPEFPCIGNKAFRAPATWTFTRRSQSQAQRTSSVAARQAGAVAMAPDGPSMMDGEETQTVTLPMSMQFDCTMAVREAVLLGAGMAVLPDYAAEAEVAAGNLIRVLPEWTLREGNIHAVFPAARFRAPKVRAFIDILIEQEHARKLLPGGRPESS